MTRNLVFRNRTMYRFIYKLLTSAASAGPPAIGNRCPSSRQGTAMTRRTRMPFRFFRMKFIVDSCSFSSDTVYLDSGGVSFQCAWIYFRDQSGSQSRPHFSIWHPWYRSSAISRITPRSSRSCFHFSSIAS